MNQEAQKPEVKQKQTKCITLEKPYVFLKSVSSFFLALTKYFQGSEADSIIIFLLFPPVDTLCSGFFSLDASLTAKFTSPATRKALLTQSLSCLFSPDKREKQNHCFCARGDITLFRPDHNGMLEKSGLDPREQRRGRRKELLPFSIMHGTEKTVEQNNSPSVLHSKEHEINHH